VSPRRETTAARLARVERRLDAVERVLNELIVLLLEAKRQMAREPVR